MQIKNIQLRHILIHGGITGGAIVFFELLLYIFGMANNKRLENVAIFLFVLGVFISVRRFREIVSEGKISFKKAFVIGFLTCLIIGIIEGFYTYFQLSYLSPSMMREIAEMYQEMLLNKGITDSQVEMQSAIMEQLITPGWVAFFSVFYFLFFGSIVSVIVAALLKRDENPLLKSE